MGVPSFAVVILISLLHLVAVPVAAGDSTVRIYDAKGDGEQGKSLDVLTAKLHNDATEIAIAAHFVRPSNGRVVAYLKFKGKPGYLRAVTIINTTKKYPLRFRLLGPIGGPDPEPCPGMDGVAISGAGTGPGLGKMRMTTPASCLHGGDYDAVKFKVLTQVLNRDEADRAPGLKPAAWHWSSYADRDAPDARAS